MQIRLKQYWQNEVTGELTEVPLDDCDDEIIQLANKYHGKEITVEEVDEVIEQLQSGY